MEKENKWALEKKALPWVQRWAKTKKKQITLTCFEKHIETDIKPY